MKTTKSTADLSNGNLVFTAKFVADRPSRSKYLDDRDDMDAYAINDMANTLIADFAEGNIYMVGSSEYVGPDRTNRTKPSVAFVVREDNGEGWPGNSDHSIKRYHGWRGTSDDWAFYGHGVRRCIRVSITGKRSKVVRIVFGKDLKATEE